MFHSLYFDVLNDRLQSKADEGTPVIEIELQRIEMRTPRPRMAQQQQQPDDILDSNSGPDRFSTGVAGVNLDSPEVD